MRNETLDYFKKKSETRNPSFWEKRRHKRMLKSLSKKEIDNMKNYLITVGLPIFKSNLNKKDPLHELLIKLFPKRINTLKIGELYNLYRSLKEVEHSKDKEYLDIVLSEFILNVQLSYGSEGWTLKKTLS
jgi:hypothetical protein